MMEEYNLLYDVVNDDKKDQSSDQKIIIYSEYVLKVRWHNWLLVWIQYLKGRVNTDQRSNLYRPPNDNAIDQDKEGCVTKDLRGLLKEIVCIIQICKDY